MAEKCKTCLWYDIELPHKCAHYCWKECLTDNPNYYESEDMYDIYREAGLLEGNDDG